MSTRREMLSEFDQLASAVNDLGLLQQQVDIVLDGHAVLAAIEKI